MREQPQDNLQELRLVGVHDDGQHLLLSAGSGELFRLRLDEALRRAVARPAPQRPTLSDGGTMSPRQIQAEIRAGATAESIAESSGIPLERVRRYESPVLAEREHIAQLAQSAEIGPPPPAHSAFAAEFGHGPARLGDMVTHRLVVHGIDPATVQWDSWRRRDGMWTVVARFELPEGAPASIGEEPPAMWTYNPVRRNVTNANRWAQQLSELETLDGPASPRRLSVVDRPFDVEAQPESRPEPRPEPRDAEAELLDMLRARRGQRLGVDENAEDALALLLTQGIPAAHPRPSEGPTERQRPTEEQEAEAPRPRRLEPVRDGFPAIFPRSPTADDDGKPTPEDAHLRLAPGLSSTTREITIVPRASTTTDEGTASDAPESPGGADPEDELESDTSDAPVQGTDKSEDDESPTGAAPEPTRRSSRPKRSSIPSWDEIVFGTKSE